MEVAVSECLLRRARVLKAWTAAAGSSWRPVTICLRSPTTPTRRRASRTERNSASLTWACTTRLVAKGCRANRLALEQRCLQLRYVDRMEHRTPNEFELSSADPKLRKYYFATVDAKVCALCVCFCVSVCCLVCVLTSVQERLPWVTVLAACGVSPTSTAARDIMLNNADYLRVRRK